MTITEPYTPTTEQVRAAACWAGRAQPTMTEFDRWFADVQAKAWDEGWNSRWDGKAVVRHIANPYREV